MRSFVAYFERRPRLRCGAVFSSDSVDDTAVVEGGEVFGWSVGSSDGLTVGCRVIDFCFGEHEILASKSSKKKSEVKGDTAFAAKEIRLCVDWFFLRSSNY